MKHKTWVRFLSLFLLVALLVGIVPSVLAASSADATASVAEASESEQTEETDIAPQISPPEQTELEPVGDDDVPRSEDGETLTRDEELLAPSLLGISLFAANSTGTVSKSTCVNFAQYQSLTWYCNRYYSEGSHSYGHYFYASTIAYHAVDGERCYCIEPNTTSLDGQTYTSYEADSASSTSFWMRELDSTQRDLITKILACGYPQVDYGYTAQQQYAATQTLIWEVCCKTRYASGIRYCTDYGLFSKIYAVLGDGYQATYDGIIETIVASTGTVPSFAGSSSAKSITLTYNSSTNCYEGSVTDSNAVLSYFTFAYTGVTFTKSGNTLKISVPASSASNVKGKTITGTSTLKDLDSCNPYVWENATYQTVLTNGGADDLSAYISLIWDEPTPTPKPTPTPTPEPEDGTLKIVKKCTDSTVSLSGWKFSSYISGVGTITRTTGSSGVITITDIPAGSKCTVTETTVPGYKVLAAQSVTIAEGENSTLTFTNQPITGRIQLQKFAVNTVSGDQQAESGAVFEVYLKSAGSYQKAADNVKDLITTDEDGTGTSKDLPYGVYYLKQTSGWEGYSPDETIYEVAITEDGEMVTQDVGGDDLTICNDIWTGTLHIFKVDGESKEPLSGAEFTLTGSDGSQVVLVTDETGSVTFEDLYYGVDYTWTETAAPHGYLLSDENTGTVSVEEADAEIEVTAENERRPGSITVTKQNTDGDPLFDCTFLLEYLDGDEWKPVFQSEELTPGGCSSNLIDGCLTTDESGTVTFENLWADEEVQYRLTEVSAPEGYELLAEPVFEGVLPVSYPEGEVTAEPDEIIDGTAYFYTLPITVRDGHIYTLPMTGGSGFPFVAVGVIVLFAGGLLFINSKYPYFFKNLTRRFA